MRPDVGRPGVGGAAVRGRSARVRFPLAAQDAASLSMIPLLKAALLRHGSASPAAALEAYSIAVAVREANPPLDVIPVIIQHLPELALLAGGSIRGIERQIRQYGEDRALKARS